MEIKLSRDNKLLRQPTDPKILVVGVATGAVDPNPPNPKVAPKVFSGDVMPNDEAGATAVVVVPNPVVVVPKGDPNPSKPVLACVVAAGVEEPKIDVAGAGVVPKLNVFGEVVVAILNPPKSVGFVCVPKRFVPLILIW